MKGKFSNLNPGNSLVTYYLQKGVERSAEDMIIHEGQGLGRALPGRTREEIRFSCALSSLFESVRAGDLKGVSLPGALDRKYPNARNGDGSGCFLRSH
jgi:hypothetical protein